MKSIQKPQVWELSRLCQETSTKLYVHELGFWLTMNLGQSLGFFPSNLFRSQDFDSFTLAHCILRMNFLLKSLKQECLSSWSRAQLDISQLFSFSCLLGAPEMVLYSIVGIFLSCSHSVNAKLRSAYTESSLGDVKLTQSNTEYTGSDQKIQIHCFFCALKSTLVDSSHTQHSVRLRLQY